MTSTIRRNEIFELGKMLLLDMLASRIDLDFMTDSNSVFIGRGSDSSSQAIITLAGLLLRHILQSIHPQV